MSDMLRNYCAIDYSISNLVIIESGDHVNLKENHYYEEADRQYIRMCSKAETDAMIAEAIEGKDTIFDIVFSNIHLANIKSMKDFIDTSSFCFKWSIRVY